MMGGNMERVVELIRDKVKYLEKLHKLNEEELLKFADSDFDTLEEFYHNREGILNLVGKIDKMIKEVDAVCDFRVTEVSPEIQKEIIQTLDYKNSLVTEILSQDLQVLSFIESAKSNIINELQGIKKIQKFEENKPARPRSRERMEEL